MRVSTFLNFTLLAVILATTQAQDADAVNAMVEQMKNKVAGADFAKVAVDAAKNGGGDLAQKVEAKLAERAKEFNLMTGSRAAMAELQKAEVAKKLQKSMQGLSDGSKQKIDGARQMMESVGSKAKSDVKRMLSQVGNLVKGGTDVNKYREKAQESIRKVMGKLNIDKELLKLTGGPDGTSLPGLDAVMGQLSVLSPELSGLLSQEGMRELVKSSFDKVTNGAMGKGKDAANGAVGKAKDAVDGAVGKAKDAVQGGVDKAKDAVKNGIDKAKDAVKNGVDKAKDAVNGAVGDAVNKAKDAVNGAVGGAVDKAKDAVNGAVGDVVNKAKDAANGAVGGAVDKAKDAVGGAVNNVRDSVLGNVKLPNIFGRK